MLADSTIRSNIQGLNERVFIDALVFPGLERLP